jgi:hypothetical protein
VSRLLLLVAGVAVLLATGGSCTESGLSTASTITEAEANEQGARRITEAAGQLAPKPELVEKPNQDVVCRGLSSSGPEQLTVGRVYELRGLDPDRAPAYVDTLRGYWTGQGYRVMDGTASYPLLRVEHPDDGFTLSFSVRNGVAEMTAVISCIWPDGTPPPTS